MTKAESALLDKIEKTVTKLGLEIVVNPKTGDCRLKGDTSLVTEKLKDVLKEAKPLILERAGFSKSAIVVEEPPKETAPRIKSGCWSESDGNWPGGHDVRISQCEACPAKFCQSCAFRFDNRCIKCGECISRVVL